MKKSNNFVVFFGTLGLIMLISLSSILFIESEIKTVWFTIAIFLLSIFSLMIYNRDEMTVKTITHIKSGTKFIKTSQAMPIQSDAELVEGFLTQIQIRDSEGLLITYLLRTFEELPGKVDQWHVKTVEHELIPLPEKS